MKRTGRGSRKARARVPGPAVVVALVLGGCAARIHTGMDEPVRPPGSVPVRSLALMPITAESGSEGFRPGVSDELVLRLRRELPDVAVMDPAEVSARLSSSPASTEYADLLADYERTGVIESARLGRITRALGVTHFLQLRVGYSLEGFLEPDPFSHGTSWSEESQQTIVAVARLWSDSGVGPVWEAVARASSRSGFLTRQREPYEVASELVASLVGRMPVTRGEVGGPR